MDYLVGCIRHLLESNEFTSAIFETINQHFAVLASTPKRGYLPTSACERA
jgi:hypothetical protein